MPPSAPAIEITGDTERALRRPDRVRQSLRAPFLPRLEEERAPSIEGELVCDRDALHARVLGRDDHFGKRGELLAAGADRRSAEWRFRCEPSLGCESVVDCPVQGCPNAPPGPWAGDPIGAGEVGRARRRANTCGQIGIEARALDPGAKAGEDDRSRPRRRSKLLGKGVQWGHGVPFRKKT
jgi:hypothetical protein